MLVVKGVEKQMKLYNVCLFMQRCLCMHTISVKEIPYQVNGETSMCSLLIHSKKNSMGRQFYQLMDRKTNIEILK